MTQIVEGDHGAAAGAGGRMKPIEETLWKVGLTFQDVGDFSVTLEACEWDQNPLRALERVMVRFGINKDRVRGTSVEAWGATRTIG